MQLTTTDWQNLERMDWSKLFLSLDQSATRIPPPLHQAWTQAVLRAYFIGHAFSAGTTELPSFERLDSLTGDFEAWKQIHGSKAMEEGSLAVTRLMMGWIVLTEEESFAPAVQALTLFNWPAGKQPVGMLFQLQAFKFFETEKKMVEELNLHVRQVLSVIRPPQVPPTIPSKAGSGCASVVLAIVSLGVFSLLLCLR